MLVDPCVSAHQIGACPLIKLEPPPIFKPRGIAKKALEVQNQKYEPKEKEDMKAKVNSAATKCILKTIDQNIYSPKLHIRLVND